MLPASRALLRSGVRASSFAPARTVAGRRFITTEPPHLRSRSWKSGALRWGIAIAGLYYYNTSPVFAERPESNLLNPDIDAIESDSPTLDALTASSRRKSQRDASVLQSAIEKSSVDDASPEQDSSGASNASIALESPSELEEEAAGEGAFNPVTGEINWDCPCLGGMAYGPCGPQFREAFSCFVYSTEEPKGMDCIDKFQNMQNCFREYPEVYKGEIEDEDELDAELAQEKEQLVQEIAERKKAADGKTMEKSTGSLLQEPVDEENPKKPKKSKKQKDSKSTTAPHESEAAPQQESKVASSSEPHPGMSAEHEALNEGVSSPVTRKTNTKPIDTNSIIEDELVPKAAHDATSATASAK